MKSWARTIMQKHASTRERLTHLESFYQTIWSNIGYPSSIIDLACALDPLALPWFNNPSLNAFYAVDIHRPRLDFFRDLFSAVFPFAKTIQQDFIAEPIQIKADCAFFIQRSTSHGKTEISQYKPIDPKSRCSAYRYQFANQRS